MEALEHGLSYTQETMLQTNEDLAEWRETMRVVAKKQQEAIAWCQETIEQQRHRIDNVLSLLSSLS